MLFLGFPLRSLASRVHILLHEIDDELLNKVMEFLSSMLDLY